METLIKGIRTYLDSGKGHTAAHLSRISGVGTATISRLLSSRQAKVTSDTWLALHHAAPSFIPPPPIMGCGVKGEAAELLTPPLSSLKLKVIDKIKLLDDIQVAVIAAVIQALGQAGAGTDNQTGRTKVKPGKRTMVVDEVEEIGVIELPGELVKNNKK